MASFRAPFDFESLPSAIQQSILSLATADSRTVSRACKHVCKEWRDIMRGICKKLVIFGDDRLVTQTINEFAQLQKAVDVHPDVSELVLNLQSEYAFDSDYLSDDGRVWNRLFAALSLKGWVSVTVLGTVACPTSPVSSAFLPLSLDSLKSLTLEKVSIPKDELLLLLPNARNLERLIWQGRSFVCAEDFETVMLSLPAMNAVQELQLTQIQQWSKMPLPAASTLPSISTVFPNLRILAITDRRQLHDGAYLKLLPGLRFLRVLRIDGDDENFSDVVLSALTQYCPFLDELSLGSRTGVFSWIYEDDDLDLEECIATGKITPQGVTIFGRGCSLLTSLKLGRTPQLPKEAWPMLLENFRNLEVLECDLDGGSAKPLGSLMRLRELATDVKSTSDVVRIAESIASLPNFHKLTVLPELDPEVVARLRELLPNVEVVINDEFQFPWMSYV